MLNKLFSKLVVRHQPRVEPDTQQKAKKEQVTADVIKRAIDKAKGGSDENKEIEA